MGCLSRWRRVVSGSVPQCLVRMENTFRVNYDRIKAEAVKIAAKELRRLRDAPCRASCCHWNRSESATLFHGKSVPSDAEARLPYKPIFFA